MRPAPRYASHKLDHSLVRRLVARELGAGAAALAGGRGGQAAFPPRMLGSLGLQRRTLGHLSAVYCVVFDCTGRYVITGADDMLVKVWSALDARLVATLRGVGAEVTDVCASADGALVACGSVDKLVRVWCLRSGEPRAVLSAHAGTITSVHWAPPARRDVRWLASTSTGTRPPHPPHPPHPPAGPAHVFVSSVQTARWPSGRVLRKGTFCRSRCNTWSA